MDQCNSFGNWGGGWNWDSVATLVNWIGTEKKKIPFLDMLMIFLARNLKETESTTSHTKNIFLPSKLSFSSFGMSSVFCMMKTNDFLVLCCPSLVTRSTQMWWQFKCPKRRRLGWYSHFEIMLMKGNPTPSMSCSLLLGLSAQYLVCIHAFTLHCMYCLMRWQGRRGLIPS